ncbi:MAG: hypothetical protein LBR13_07415 [Dysgonamonadaceae bacterium]|jgi:hypothetical protein|nr:hypothetical protein [Dysgonamonadaceae bacterium]
MKKVVLFALAALISAGFASAQRKFEGGNFALLSQLSGGSGLNVSNYSVGDYSKLDVNFQVSPMFFVFDKLALKGSLGATGSKYEGSDLDLVYNFGIGARFYIAGGFFAGAGVSGTKSDGSDVVGGAEAEVGYSLFVNDKVFIEPSIMLTKQLDFKEFEFYDGLRVSFLIGLGFVF